MNSFLENAGKVEQLLNTKKKLVAYHRDTDGTTSAALLLRFFPSETLPLESPTLDPLTVYKIKEKKPDLIIFLDLAIDQDWKEIHELEKTVRILIIDHHLFDRDLNSTKTLYVNPRFERKDTYLAAAYLVYHLLKKMGKDIKKYAWIAGIGVIGDYAFGEGKDVLDDVRALSPALLKGTNPRESLLAEGGKIISSAITVAGDKGGEKALHALVQAETFEEFAEGKELAKWKGEVEKEIILILKDFEKKREFYPAKNISIFTVESRLPVISTISTLLAEKYPDMTLCIKRRDEEGFKISLRNQSGRVDLNAIARTATKGIGRGGGHEKAAGAFVTDWEMFKKRFLKELEK